MISIDTLILFLVAYDSIVSFIAFYSFYIMILRPFIKYRHTKKSGIYTEFTLYDKGEYRGSINLNISELLNMLFNAGNDKQNSLKKSFIRNKKKG
ncbi:MAG: hypothetical protein QXU98_04175 [Candidatus Parvarchaeota archaeon]